MNEISIIEVQTRKELKKFIQFPNDLFKNVPTYIPPLWMDEKNVLSAKNPSREHCDCKMFLAMRNNQVVGRVAAIINHLCNQQWNKKSVRFGWFDFIEDFDVFSALIAKVEEFGRQYGMTEIEGPLGFTDMDKECWMIDGFDQRQNISTLYNPEYYIRFIERLNFEVKCRWQQYRIFVGQEIPEKIFRVKDMIRQKYELKVVKFKKRKEIYPYARKFFYTLNSSFKDLFDFVPLTEKEIDVYVKEYFPFVNLEFANFVVDKDDNLIAFGLGVPNLGDAYQKAKGRLFPFGWFHLLRALRHFDQVDLLLTGVHPDWQKKGVHSLYFAEMTQNLINNKVKYAYTNPQIIGYEAVKIWSKYNGEELMKRAVFGKSLI